VRLPRFGSHPSPRPPSGAALLEARRPESLAEAPLVDVRTGAYLGAARDHPIGGAESVAFSPDGRVLAIGSGDGSVRLTELETGDPVRDPLLAHTSGVMSLAFSPDGALLASANRNGTLRLWDPATGEPLGPPLEGDGQPLTSVAFNSQKPAGRGLRRRSTRTLGAAVDHRPGVSACWPLPDPGPGRAAPPRRPGHCLLLLRNPVTGSRQRRL
jgi:hypothetical protein